MTCREAQSLIVPFIENRLNDEQKEAFIRHVESCSACYDELEVYFIVFSGIRQLDGTYQEDISDFKGALRNYIAQQKENMNKKMHKSARRRAAAVLLIVFAMFAGGIFYSLYKNNRDVLHQAVIKVESIFIYNKAEPIKKSVEYTLDIDDWKKSNFKEIIRNEEVEPDEKDSTD